MKNIGLNIKKLRELKGWSRSQLAEKLNISERGYGKIENGEVSITLDKLQEISNFLEIDPMNLLQFDESIIFNNCNENISVLNKGIIHFDNQKAFINTQNELINSLKEQLKVKDELLKILRNK